jgi:hypothetical protein
MRLLVAALLVGLAMGFPAYSTNDVVPEMSPPGSELKSMDDYLAVDEKKHMSLSDIAMEQMMEASGAAEGEVSVADLDKKAADPPAPKMAATSTEVHDAIVELKAYCVNVFGKAQNIDEGHSAKSVKGSSVVPFLIAFGQHGQTSTKTQTGGIITEYADLVGKFLGQYNSGIGHYMLSKLNNAILEGRNVLSFEKKGGKQQYTISYATLGLQTEPRYLRPLDSSIGEMMTTKVKVSELNQGADTKAAVAVVTAKHNEAFKEYYKAALAKEEAAKKQAELKVAATAFTASEDAFKKAYASDPKTKLVHVAVQSGEAMEAAEEAKAEAGPPAKTDAELKSQAEAEAKKVDAATEASVSTTAKTVQVLEDEASGKVSAAEKAAEAKKLADAQAEAEAEAAKARAEAEAKAEAKA